MLLVRSLSTLIEKLFIDYMYSVFGSEIERLMYIKPGEIVLRNNRYCNLFEHEHVIYWHDFLINVFHSKHTLKNYALILPCSSIKPYRVSPVHYIVDKYLERYSIQDKVQVYVLSEPMILVPRELDIYYPFANYDYPPRELSYKYRIKFVDILVVVLEKLEYHKYVFAFLPKHHKSILGDALKKCGYCIDIEVFDYGKKVFQQAKYVVENLYNVIKKEI